MQSAFWPIITIYSIDRSATTRDLGKLACSRAVRSKTRSPNRSPDVNLEAIGYAIILGIVMNVLSLAPLNFQNEFSNSVQGGSTILIAKILSGLKIPATAKLY